MTGDQNGLLVTLLLLLGQILGTLRHRHLIGRHGRVLHHHALHLCVCVCGHGSWLPTDEAVLVLALGGLLHPHHPNPGVATPTLTGQHCLVACLLTLVAGVVCVQGRDRPVVLMAGVRVLAWCTVTRCHLLHWLGHITLLLNNRLIDRWWRWRGRRRMIGWEAGGRRDTWSRRWGHHIACLLRGRSL